MVIVLVLYLGIEIIHTPKNLMKMKKGILINTTKRTIEFVDVKDWKDIYNHIECQTFTCVDVDGLNTVYIDDEGLLTLTPQSTFFQIEGYPQPLCGNGLILGIDHEEGESVDTTLSLQYVKSKVKFMDLYEVQMKSRLGVF
jgi:hypothetical protein